MALSFKEIISVFIRNICVIRVLKTLLRQPLGVGLLYLLCGCITKYEAKGIDETADILVVEGIITDEESTITLSRSIGLTEGNAGNYFVNNARVYVECDDETRWQAEPYIFDEWAPQNGRYTIKTGQLNMERTYRLKIEIDELPAQTSECCSDYSCPIQTPEIDSVFWMKRGQGQPVMIHVATHSPDNDVLYYRWSYQEDWEINSEIMVDNYPYYCWNVSKSKDILVGSAEKTVFGRITDKLTEISPRDRRFSVLYQIDVKQNAISKRAYDYFANIKKNAQQTGSIFAPTPSELRGNIICTTDPDKPVIGYMDVSTTSQKRRYIWPREVYERPSSNCPFYTSEELYDTYGDDIAANPESFWENWVDVLGSYVSITCVDCTWHGTTQKPDDWPK